MALFAHIDCNNFYASCERVFNPSLIGVPVIVLSNNDGCAIARSQEAKDLGIKMGEPFFKFKSLVEDNKISVFSANFELYGDMSNRVMTIASQYSPDVEIYSIDECFLNLEGVSDNPRNYCLEIKRKIEKCTKIPV
ncbi:MAG: SOS mutagenesis and repair protein UmuC, partial [Bacteroidales bacterium]|nr:SOS mutagenesis and repair protein UmuC [Bacteroidales bacterium]